MKLAGAKLLSFAAMLCACIAGDSVGHALAVLHGRGYLARTVYAGTVSHGRVAARTFLRFDDEHGRATAASDHVRPRGQSVSSARFCESANELTPARNVGAIQSTAYDIALAQQIKADCPNAKLVLDFHYSDTWADPGHQSKPQNLAAAAIQDRTGEASDLPTLNTTVRNYTRDTLTAFQSAGVMPDIVQLGNETIGGMLWQTGATGGAAVGGRILYQNNTYTGLACRTTSRPRHRRTKVGVISEGC